MSCPVSSHFFGGRELVSKGYRINGTSFRAYKFSNVKLAGDNLWWKLMYISLNSSLDDDEASSASNDFGTISVEVHRVLIEYLPEDYTYTPYALPNDMGMPLSERSKKIGAHRVELGSFLNLHQYSTADSLQFK